MENSDIIEKIISGAEKYEITTSTGTIKIFFVETEGILKFLITGPKQIISKAIGGLGEENETEAWATEKELDTEAKRMFAVLEILKIANNNE